MSTFDFHKSTISKYRAGTSTDPYIDITEIKKIINGQIQLSEIPVLINKVRITNYFEIPGTNTKKLSGNEYRVDYTEGIVSFSPSEEGKNVTVIYKGRGNHYISVSRVWTKENNGEVIETLGDILEAGNDAVGNIQKLAQLMDETTTAKDETIKATAEAHLAANQVVDVINEARDTIDETRNTNDEIVAEEILRVDAENTRIANDLERIQNEDLRQVEENTRQSNETIRMDSEIYRESNESVRVQQEEERQQNTENAILNVQNAVQDIEYLINKTKGVGQYSSIKEYNKNNIVTYNGSSYLALQDNLLGISPTDALKWQLVAQRGVDGNGSVVSVNSIHPDLNGNIQLSPSDIGAQQLSDKGMPNGYANLDENGNVPLAQLGNIETMVKHGNEWHVEDYETVENSKTRTTAAENNAKEYLDNKFGDHFDTAKTNPLTLQPGLQVVNAEREARFKLGEIRGRTLINLLGNTGSGESTGKWSTNQVTFELDSSVKRRFATSLKVISNGVATEHFIGLFNAKDMVPIMAGKNYIITGYIKPNEGTTAYIRPITFNGDVSYVTKDYGNVQLITNSEKFNFSYFSLKALPDSALLSLRLQVIKHDDQMGVANFSEIAVYEIPNEEYQSLDYMTTEEIERRYSFVPLGIRGMENPYAIAISDNLLPPLYETNLATGHRVTEPYTLTIDKDSDFSYSQLQFLVVPNTEYTVTVSGSNFQYSVYPTDLNEPDPPVPWSREISRTFNSGNNTTLLLLMRSLNTANLAVVKNPKVAVGSKLSSFSPQRKSMLAFQTELHANPIDGSDPDVLFELDGEYLILKKWKKVLLDGSFTPNVVALFPGYKVIRLDSPAAGGIQDYGFLTKYDGTQITRKIYGLPIDAASQFVSGSNGDLHISIADIDSGWGDSYTPTPDEIKAYFNGWRMASPDNWGVPYPGTGTKAWGKVDRNGYLLSGSGTDTLPTFLNTEGGYVPYNLLCRLAKEIVEPITVEGCLTLAEGNNMVEVGTGIVLRESVKPYVNVSIGQVGLNALASPNYPGSGLKHTLSRFLSIYRNSCPDRKWSIKDSNQGNGNQFADILLSDYEQSSAYSATYLKLDKSPISPIVGMLTANEKAQISDLTAGVAEALQRTSVLEQKKAEKDAPGWIAPTLLNGAVQGSNPVGYKKLPNGLVLLRGIFVAATSGIIFRLPTGYRPKEVFRANILSISGSFILGNLEITPTGEVHVGYYGTDYSSLDGVVFGAEQ